MKKLRFEITINAPKETVWHAMLDDQSYREWTSTFGNGGYFIGDWSKGSKMKFVATEETTGKEMGMLSRIAENIPYKFISIEHIGMIQDGIEDTESDDAKAWSQSHENYTFEEENESTRVIVEIDVMEKYEDMFNDLWPKSLELLKEIAEKQQ